jgi:hypothetical protein
MGMNCWRSRAKFHLFRLVSEMTFAEFSHETTKQYYGGSSTQNKCYLHLYFFLKS